jgi:RNA polymerase subunit RPABC4/transcription elongation factor Spt4
MLVGAEERCARCGTLLRGGRQLCPSCGLDQQSPEATGPLAEVPVAVAPVETKTVAPRKSICPTCMSSVREDQLVDYEGQRLCGDCKERIKAKMRPKKTDRY